MARTRNRNTKKARPSCEVLESRNLLSSDLGSYDAPSDSSYDFGPSESSSYGGSDWSPSPDPYSFSSGFSPTSLLSSGFGSSGTPSYSASDPWSSFNVGTSSTTYTSWFSPSSFSGSSLTSTYGSSPSFGTNDFGSSLHDPYSVSPGFSPASFSNSSLTSTYGSSPSFGTNDFGSSLYDPYSVSPGFSPASFSSSWPGSTGAPYGDSLGSSWLDPYSVSPGLSPASFSSSWPGGTGVNSYDTPSYGFDPLWPSMSQSLQSLSNYLPHGGGVQVGGAIEGGLGYGTGTNGSIGRGVFYSSDQGWNGGSFASGGLSTIGPYSIMSTPSGQNLFGNFVSGLYVGAGVSGYVTNAQRFPDTFGPFSTWAVNTGEGPNLGSVQVEWGPNAQGQNIWVIVYSPPFAGIGFGASFSGYRTSTKPLWSTLP